jgi:hypothetical protein
MMKQSLLLAAVLSATACTATTPVDVEQALKQATHEALPDTDTAQIEISGQKQLVAKWEWRASHAGKVFACDADNRMRLPSCSELATANSP